MIIRRRLTPTLLLLGALLTAAAGIRGQSPNEHWVAAWGTAQQYYQAPAPPQPQAAAQPAVTLPQPAAAPPASGPARRFPIPPRLTGFSNQTIRMIVRVSRGGQRLRIRLFNALGARPLRIGAARVALRDSGSAIVATSDRQLTFAGRSTITVHAGQTMVSDPVGLEVRPLSDVAVSLYVQGESGPPTSHLFGLRPTYVSREGDVSGAREIADTSSGSQSWYWLAGVDVLAPPADGVLVTFGDSITDGDQSTPDGNGSWPSVLMQRLQAGQSTRGVGVVNAGISGNRVFGDNNSALARLDHDVFSVPGVRWMTLLEGINDITGATRPSATAPALSAEDLIAAYKQIIERAHDRGIKVIGCTLTPFGGSNVYTEAGEAIRTAVNTWIRKGGGFDAVIDFDLATRDPRDLTRFRAEADSPDLLHPGDAGYRLMAEAVDLAIFTGGRSAVPVRKPSPAADGRGDR